MKFLHSTTLSKTLSLYHWCVSKNSSSRDFEKFPFNQCCKLIAHRNKGTLNQTFKDALNISWNSSAIKFLFSKFKAYKLLPSALHVFKIQENSWDNMCSGIPFNRRRCVQVLYRITALNSFLKVYLKRTPTWMFYWKVSKNFPRGYCFPKRKWKGASDNSNIFLSRAPMDTSEWWERNCQNKIALEKYVKINKHYKDCKESEMYIIHRTPSQA